MSMWLALSGLGVLPVAMAEDSSTNLKLNASVQFDAWDGGGSWQSVSLASVEAAVAATCAERDANYEANDSPWRNCAADQGSVQARMDKAEVVTAAVFSDKAVTIHVHLPAGWKVEGISYTTGDQNLDSKAGDNDFDKQVPKDSLKVSEDYAAAAVELPTGHTRIKYLLKVTTGKEVQRTEGEDDKSTLVAFRDKDGNTFISTASGAGGGRVVPTGRSTLTTLTSGIDQGAILLGLSDYLLDRAEAELRAWAIQSQVGKLCKTQSASGKPPLPGDFLESTCAALANDGVSMVFNGTSLLQEAARKDLNALVRNVGEAAIVYYNEQPVSTESLNPHDVGASLALMGRVLELVLDGEHPLDAIAGMVTGKDWGGLRPSSPPQVGNLGEHYQLTSAILLGAVGVVGIRDTADQDNELRSLLDQPFVWALEAPALVVGYRSNLTEANLDGLHTALLSDKALAAIEALVQHLTTSDALTTIETNLKRVQELISKTTLGADPDDLPALRQQLLQAYAQVAAETMDLSAGAVGAMTVPELSDALSQKLTKAQALLTDLSHVAAHTAKGAYGPALLNGLALLTDRISVGAHAAPDQKKLSEDLRTALGVVQTQLTFFATLSEANTPEAAQAAIAAWASPVGSYRTKHLSDGPWVGLNAYVGMGGGQEWLRNVDGLDQRWSEGALAEGAWQFAPLMSVGLEFGWNSKRPLTPERTKLCCGGTTPRVLSPYLGLYLQALDLGAIGTFRMDDSVESTESEAQTIEANLTSKLRVQHVFSPGAFIVVAPFNAPFTIGLGGSLVPSLRSISIDGEPQLDDADALRAGLFLAVDMPLIHN